MEISIARLYCAQLTDRLKDVDVSKFSRLSTERLAKTALLNISRIELVSGHDFQHVYTSLYEAMFHDGERERAALIVSRLQDELDGKRHGLSPFRVVGLRDSHDQAIGAAQFSILKLRGASRIMVPYLQYIYVRSENRRQDMSELLHALVLALTQAEAQSAEGDDHEIPFTFFETDPPCHGATEAARANAEQRTRIHARSGSQALMFRNPTTDRVVSAHVQPGLEWDDPPLTVIWVLRPSPAMATAQDVNALGDGLIAAYYQSLRDEGFYEKNIALAEGMVQARRPGNEFFLMPLADVTREMYHDIDGS